MGRMNEEFAVAGRDAVNVVGGMTAWMAAGLSVVRDDGGPGKVV